MKKKKIKLYCSVYPFTLRDLAQGWFHLNYERKKKELKINIKK